MQMLLWILRSLKAAGRTFYFSDLPEKVKTVNALSVFPFITSDFLKAPVSTGLNETTMVEVSIDERIFFDNVGTLHPQELVMVSMINLSEPEFST
jgi:hypothetical protein